MAACYPPSQFGQSSLLDQMNYAPPLPPSAQMHRHLQRQHEQQMRLAMAPTLPLHSKPDVLIPRYELQYEQPQQMQMLPPGSDKQNGVIVKTFVLNNDTKDKKVSKGDDSSQEAIEVDDESEPKPKQSKKSKKNSAKEAKAVKAKEVKTVKTKQKRPRDRNRPRRALSAYNIFFQEQKATLDEQRERQKAEGGEKTKWFETLAKIIGARWKEIPQEKRKHYIDLANVDKKRYEEEKERYEINKAAERTRKHEALEKAAGRAAMEKYQEKATEKLEKSVKKFA